MDNNYLMHYGIKGMKWGVRKAIQKNSGKALVRHYKRARKKLDRLEQKANINDQRAEAKRYLKRAAVSGSLGAAGVGVGSGKLIKSLIKSHKAGNALANGMVSSIKIPEHKIHETIIPEHKIHETIIPEHKIHETIIPEHKIEQHVSSGISPGSKSISSRNAIKQGLTAAGLGALGYAGYSGVRSLSAKHRTTPKGHAKAVKKRDDFKKAMYETFNQPDSRKLSATVVSDLMRISDKSNRRRIKRTILNSRKKSK